MQARTKKSPFWEKTNSLKRENSKEYKGSHACSRPEASGQQRPTRLSEKTPENSQIFTLSTRLKQARSDQAC